jgi:hypothetical protein
MVVKCLFLTATNCSFQLITSSERTKKNSLLAELMNIALSLLSGEELYNIVLEYGDIIFGFESSKQKFHGFGLTHNMVKQSIF